MQTLCSSGKAEPTAWASMRKPLSPLWGGGAPEWEKRGGILPRASSRPLHPSGCRPWIRGTGNAGLGLRTRPPPSESLSESASLRELGTRKDKCRVWPNSAWAFCPVVYLLIFLACFLIPNHIHDYKIKQSRYT